MWRGCKRPHSWKKFFEHYLQLAKVLYSVTLAGFAFFRQKMAQNCRKKIKKCQNSQNEEGYGKFVYGASGHLPKLFPAKNFFSSHALKHQKCFTPQMT